MILIKQLQHNTTKNRRILSIGCFWSVTIMIKDYDGALVCVFIFIFIFSRVFTKMSKTCCDAMTKTSQFHKGFTEGSDFESSLYISDIALPKYSFA